MGKVDGKVCFVSDALPGEEVVFAPRKETKSFTRGELLEILKPSPERVKPVCQYYGKCGGCQLQHLDYAAEVRYKREQVVQLVRRISGIETFECPDIQPSEKPYNYRSSVTLHATPGKRCGFFDRGGSSIIEVESCSVAEECISGEISRISAVATKSTVVIKSDHEGRVWVSDQPGSRFFTDRYLGRDIYLSTKAFSQCNRFITEKIAQTLNEWMGFAGSEAVFFDVFCGTGIFSFLAPQDTFGLKVGIDSDRVAIDCAKTTVKTQSLEGFKFFKGEAESEFIRLYDHFRKERNVILLDPPRKGLEKPFLEALGGVKSADAIFYISCDPARLARDIKILVSGGKWQLGRARIFDMFPRTKHIETLVEFTRV